MWRWIPREKGDLVLKSGSSVVTQCGFASLTFDSIRNGLH